MLIIEDADREFESNEGICTIMSLYGQLPEKGRGSLKSFLQGLVSLQAAMAGGALADAKSCRRRLNPRSFQADERALFRQGLE